MKRLTSPLLLILGILITLSVVMAFLAYGTAATSFSFGNQAAEAPPQKTSATMADMSAYPLTQPPDIPFIPPTPWPAQPPYTIYLFDPFERDSLMIPLDPQTLADLPTGKTLTTRVFAADGSTAVDMIYAAGRANPDPAESWIVVSDLQSGTEKSRFNPPVTGFVSALSADGQRLLFEPEPFSFSSRYPPPVEWLVLDSSSGQQVGHVKDEDNACFRQRGLLDAAGQHIYCVVDPAFTPAKEPEPLQIAAYDVESGLKVGQLLLPEVLIGGRQAEFEGQSLMEFLEPVLVLSPDGQQLTVVHADADKVTLVAAHDLTVERTFSLADAVGFWRWFAPETAYAKGPGISQVWQAEYSLDGRYLYVFKQEVLMLPDQEAPEALELSGLSLVDLERGIMLAEALLGYQIQWLEPAPDGTVFVFGTAVTNLGPYEIRPTSPSMLWRLDGLSLEILAERAFPGYMGGRVVAAQ